MKATASFPCRRGAMAILHEIRSRIFARIAFGCDYCDVRPVRGVYTGASVPSMSVIVAMEALTGTKQQR
jgi:hypothetical protein